ncbi:MAG: hypothetical protein U0441_09915 [Polyangiaceae bacterium]
MVETLSRMRALRFWMVGSMLAAAVLTGGARSASASGPTEPAVQARRYYEDGVAAADAKDWEKAYASFTEAWKLKQHWQIAVNLGQAELRLGKYADAADHLSYYLREATEQHPEDVKQAREWLDQAKQKAGILRLNVAPKGAQIFVDGKLVGTAPLDREAFVDVGWHAVEVRSGDQKALRQVEAPAGRQVDVSIGVGGAVPDPLPDQKDGAAPAVNVSSVLAPRTLVVAGTSAFALVNFVVGGVTASASIAKGSEQDKLCVPTCPQSRTVQQRWYQIENDRVSSANAAVAAFVLGGLATAGAAAAFVLMKPKTPPSAPVTALHVTAGPAGISILGAF